MSEHMSVCKMVYTLWIVYLQGPLPNTCGHFWEMVWEQKSRGVVMLNRVMEKGSVSHGFICCLPHRPYVSQSVKLTFLSELISLHCFCISFTLYLLY